MKLSWILLPSLFLLTTCREAELSEGSLKPEQKEAGRQFLSTMEPLLPNCKGALRARGEDEWFSWFLRLFTPLDRKRERFEIMTEGDYVWLKLGDGQEFSYRDGTLYRLNGAEGTEETSSWDQMYVESLSVYLRLAFVMQGSSDPALLSTKKIGPNAMKRLYFRDGEDQYVAYFDSDSSQIRAFRFTSRSISRSYKGWIRWQSMQNFGAMFFPSRIIIQDAYEDSTPIHEIKLSEVSCVPSVAQNERKPKL